MKFIKIRKPLKNFAETPPKKEETPQLNQVFKIRKRLKNFAEMPQKYWEIPQKYWEIPQK